MRVSRLIGAGTQKPRNLIFYPRLWIALWLVGCSAAPSASSEALTRLRAGAAWDDPLRCQEAVRSGARLPRASFRVRVGTWSLKWFPDGSYKGMYESTRSDVDWLACTIAWLDVDLLALQTVKLTPAGQAALDTLVTKLGELTGERWRWHADPCPDPERAHLVLLYRQNRLEVTLIMSHPEIDPTTRPDSPTPECRGFLRPALAGYVTSKEGGLDFHFATTQLDGGTEERDFANRQVAWMKLDEVLRKRIAYRVDEDFVIAADFNSSGCADRGIPTSAHEREVLVEAMRELSPSMIVAEPTERCSFLSPQRAESLDHILYSATMKEAQGAGARVVGLCRAAKCRPVLQQAARALRRLSQHCPVVLDLRDQDDD